MAWAGEQITYANGCWLAGLIGTCWTTHQAGRNVTEEIISCLM